MAMYTLNVHFLKILLLFFYMCSKWRADGRTIQRMDPVGCWNWCEPLQRVFTVARPKSPIFTAVMSSVRKMLFDFRSR